MRSFRHWRTVAEQCSARLAPFPVRILGEGEDEVCVRRQGEGVIKQAGVVRRALLGDGLVTQ